MMFIRKGKTNCQADSSGQVLQGGTGELCDEFQFLPFLVFKCKEDVLLSFEVQSLSHFAFQNVVRQACPAIFPKKNATLSGIVRFGTWQNRL